MATTLTGLRVQDTYNAIIKIGDNSTLTGTGKLLSDGFGNNSNLYLSTTSLGIGVAPTENLHIAGSMRLTGSFKDKNNQSGTTGQVLTSTATGTDWKTISDIDGVTSATGGTANYVPVFTSARNIENSIIQASATLVTISGNLDVNGTVTYIDTIDLSVKDPLIKLANANVSNTLDIGFYGKYVVSATTKYLGLYSDASDSNKFRLFTGLESEPTTVVDSSDTTFAVGTLIANFEGDLIGNVTGNVTGGTISGTTGTFSSSVAINAGSGYPLLTSSSQRYNIQIRNTNNTVNSGYGWWLATDTNFNFAIHADGVGDKFTLTRDGDATFAGSITSTGLNVNSSTYHKVIATFPSTYVTNLQIGQQFNINNDALSDTVTFAHTGVESASDFIFTIEGNEKLKIEGDGTLDVTGNVKIENASANPEITLIESSGGTQQARISFDQAGQNALYLTTDYESATNASRIILQPGGYPALIAYGGSGGSTATSVEIKNDLTAVGIVTTGTYYKSSGTSAVLGTNASGEVLLRPTAYNLSTAQSSFTTTLATIGTNATFSADVTLSDGSLTVNDGNNYVKLSQGANSIAEIELNDSGSVYLQGWGDEFRIAVNADYTNTALKIDSSKNAFFYGNLKLASDSNLLQFVSSGSTETTDIYRDASNVLHIRNTADSSIFRLYNSGNLLISGDITTDGVFINNSAPDDEVVQFIQSGRKTSLKTSFSSNATASYLDFRISNGNVDGSFDTPLRLHPDKIVVYGTAEVSTLDAGTIKTNAIEKKTTNSPIVINSGLDGSLGLKVYYDMMVYNTLNLTDNAWNVMGRVYASSAGTLYLKGSNASNALIINSSNQVGIAMDPSFRLDVEANNNRMRLLGTTGYVAIELQNDANGFYVAREGATAGNFATGNTAYAGILAVQGNYNLQLATNGVVRTTVDGAGKVGINTETPDVDLHVTTNGTSSEDGIVKIGGSAASLGLVLEYDQAGATFSYITANPTYTSDTSIMKIRVDGDRNVNQLVLLGNGHIGMGRNDPRGNLEIITSSTVSGVSDTVNNVLIGLQSANRPTIILDTADTTYTNRTWNITNIGNIGSLFIGRNGLDVLQMRNNGAVGIGNENPLARLTIGSSQGSSLDFSYDSGNGYRNNISNYWNSSTDTRMDFNIGRTANVAPVTVMSVGYNENVGIGTQTPSGAKLVVNSSSNPQILVKKQTSGGGAEILFEHNSGGTQNASIKFDQSADNQLYITTGYDSPNDLNRIYLQPGGETALTLAGGNNATGGAGKATFAGNVAGNSAQTTEIGTYPTGGIKRIRMIQGGEIHFGDTTITNALGITEGTWNQFGDTDRIGLYCRNELKIYGNSNLLRVTIPTSGNATFAMGATFGDAVSAPSFYVDDYIYHSGDTNTYIRFTEDQFTWRTGGDDRMKLNIHALNVGPTQYLSSTVNDGPLRISNNSNGSSTMNRGSNAIQLGPNSARNATANYYYGGITWNGLLNYNSSNTYDMAPHVWVGAKYKDFPGSERSSFVVGVKSGTGTTGSGTNIPQERLELDFSGNLSITGTFTAAFDVVAYSDKRLKENIKPIKNALEKVTQLQGITYNRKDIDDKSTKIGFIAQDIQKIIPEVVQDNDEYLGVSYGNITAVLVEAIKEQQKQIVSLQNEINKLKNK